MLIKEEFRPITLPGGTSVLPLFSIGPNELGEQLTARAEPTKPAHVFIEPAQAMDLSDYQSHLCQTASSWKREP